MKTVILNRLISHLESTLRHADFQDYPGAENGLQIENSGTIRRICSAVDACEAVIAEAAQVQGTLLLVHHGLFWGGVPRISGIFARKLRAAFVADMAVFSSHLPLDAHPVFGNNALLAKLLGVRRCEPAFAAKGQPIGLVGTLRTTRTALMATLQKHFGPRVHLAPGGGEYIRKIGIVSGGAGSQIAEAAALGCDTFLTGEGPHHTYTLAEELGTNLFYAGHYATETLGVRRLAEVLGHKFKLPVHFIDHPTGL